MWGAGLFRVHMEGERTSGWLCFKSAVLLLGDTEGLNLGSAAGTKPVLEDRLFGRVRGDAPGGEPQPFPGLCGSSHAKAHNLEWGKRKRSRGGGNTGFYQNLLLQSCPAEVVPFGLI